MASIFVSDLHPAGCGLFADSETFMNELVDDEVNSVNGGISLPSTIFPIVVATRASSANCALGAGAAFGAGAAWLRNRFDRRR